MAEINIIKIDGKPLEKLIDVISKGVGTIYRPRAIRKEADAKAYEIEVIERAKAKALAEGKEIDADFHDRMQERLLHKETRRQINIDSVASIAAEQLKHETEVSDVPVDDDWTNRFFNIVEDVSNEEMQQLWGRILAGEVKRPNSYSIRTLELLRNLSKNDAETFTRVAKYAVYSQPYHFLPAINGNTYLKEKGLKFDDILHLEEIGLINTSQTLSMSIAETKQNERTDVFWFGEIGLAVIKEKECPSQSIEAFFFSKAAIELLPLIEPVKDDDYVVSFAKKIKLEKAKMKYGQKAVLPDGQVILKDAKEIAD
jgi:hypothetical protein